ncbi:putative orfan [Tupanvirus soda lake]|uniref:Orfan n=2 Tax=Tupanvirus TaxID=2094720 RepID=A0AC62AAC0_9VIRU|nr:putative orfan [Tupanvirus soda lake]QKU34732.1 putative orfan [Tupanvirus soda lake]
MTTNMEANIMKYIFENYTGMEFSSLEHFYNFIKDKTKEYQEKQFVSINMEIDDTDISKNYSTADIEYNNEIIINGDLDSEPSQFIDGTIVSKKKRKRCDIEYSNNINSNTNNNTDNDLVNSYLIYKKSRYN